jgi:ABC-type branched-subunit amino acid transport system substrate-binding protein
MRDISRRTFLAMASTLGVGSWQAPAGLHGVTKAYSQPQAPRVVRIAHLSRRQGPDAERTAYAIMGAQLGAEEAGITAGMFGTRVELIIEDAVTPQNVASLIGRLRSLEHLCALVVALDDQTTDRVSDLSQQQLLLCLNAAARSGDLRGEKCHRLTFHVEPDLAMYTHALAQWLVQNKRRRWHFIVSEESFGQEIYQRASRFLQRQGGIDLGRSVIAPGRLDHKALLAHLTGSDVEAIIVALRGEDLQQFLPQYRASGLTIPLAGVPLDMIALWQTDPTSLPGVWIASWYHELERFSAREVNRRFLRRFEKRAEGFAWANWAAVKLVAEGVLRSASTDARTLVNYLEGAPQFDGHKGKTLTFRDWNHQLRQPLYVLKARETKPDNAWDLLELLGEIPPPAARGQSVMEVLDTLGEAKTESTCRLEAR